MNIIDANIKLLNELKRFDGFRELDIVGNDFVFKNQKIDISNFSIYDLLDGQSLFGSALADLTSQEIFDIIRIHAMHINSIAPVNKDDDEKKLETIKKENPLMRNVTLVSKQKDGYIDQYLNVVDSRGIDHLYHVDRTIDVFALYDELKIAYGRDNITPEEYIAILDRKLPNVNLDSSRDFKERSDVSESFQNKLENLDRRYSGDNRVNILGNEQHDINVVADERGNHQVVTYDTNMTGDLIATSHDQNVFGSTTSTMENDTEIDSVYSNSIVDSQTEGYIEKMDKDEETITLIPFEEFKRLINSPAAWDQYEKEEVELYYGYFADLIRYEDYLLPPLAKLLAEFRYFVFELQNLHTEAIKLNEHQEELVKKVEEFEKNKELIKIDDYNNVMDDVRKLTLKMPTYNKEQDREAGSISVGGALLVIAIITLVLTILTILYIV